MAAGVGNRIPSRYWQFGGIVLLFFIFLTFLSQSLWSPSHAAASISGSKHVSAQETETLYPDGTQRYDRRAAYDAESGRREAQTLFLVLTKDSKSWSQENATAPPRTVNDMLKLLESTGIDLASASLGILTAEASEYANIIDASKSYAFARVTVIHRSPDKDLASLAGVDRHAGEIQFVRRAALARLRNYLMIMALETEEHIIWLDADVIRFSEGIVQTMIRHSETNETAGIMTAVCQKSNSGNYDQNAFRTNNAEWVEHSLPEEKYKEANEAYLSKRIGVDALVQNTSDDDLLSLTSVGGTLLYIRASLVRFGLMFPWFLVIGTSFAREGWMGLETEGLCWAARFLEGGGCYVLGGSHHTMHAD